MAKKQKRKKKVNARKLLSRLHKKADAAISLYVRAVTKAEFGGKCSICLVNPVENCFHFVRRRRKILRWDLRNLTGACHRCNYLEYRDPDPSRAWYIRRHGVEQYLAIVDESAKAFEPTVEYLQAIVDRFTSELESMKRFSEPAQEAPEPPEDPVAPEKLSEA